MKWIVVLAMASSVVAACARPWPQGRRWPKSRWWPHRYITLAEVECFAAPQPGQEYRLMGARVTSPR